MVFSNTSSPPWEWIQIPVSYVSITLFFTIKFVEGYAKYVSRYSKLTKIPRVNSNPKIVFDSITLFLFRKLSTLPFNTIPYVLPSSAVDSILKFFIVILLWSIEKIPPCGYSPLLFGEFITISNVCPSPSRIMSSLLITILPKTSVVNVHVLLAESHVPIVEQSPPVASSVIVYANADGTIIPIMTKAIIAIRNTDFNNIIKNLWYLVDHSDFRAWNMLRITFLSIS